MSREATLGICFPQGTENLPGKTKILLIRHCEAAGNTEGVFQGRIDTDISPNGEKQLELLALRCRNMKIDAMVTSPLLRAVRTAEAVNQYHRLPLETEPLLAEIDAGAFEGVKWEELPLRFPEATRSRGIFRRLAAKACGRFMSGFGRGFCRWWNGTEGRRSASLPMAAPSGIFFAGQRDFP